MHQLAVLTESTRSQNDAAPRCNMVFAGGAADANGVDRGAIMVPQQALRRRGK